MLFIRGDITAQYIKNELRAIDKLRKEPHRNIVEVLRHGDLVYMSSYFIDMELCDLNLSTYIYQKWTPEVERQMPYFTFNDLPPKLKVAQLWGIMEDIASGVAFIHQKGEVHRDIKPANGTYPDFSV